MPVTSNIIEPAAGEGEGSEVLFNGVEKSFSRFETERTLLSIVNLHVVGTIVIFDDVTGGGKMVMFERVEFMNAESGESGKNGREVELHRLANATINCAVGQSIKAASGC